MTVLDLIKRAMRLLGVLNIGEEPTADEQQDGLSALNAMTDAWATRRLLLYSTTRNVYPLTPGQQVYQIGPHASAPNWTAPRPVALDYAGVILNDVDPTNALEEPLAIIKTEAEYARIRVKGLLSTMPQAVYYDRWYSSPNSSASDAGSGNLYVWPCPTVAYQVALYTPLAIAQFTSVTQRVALPPGYARALPSNLAIEAAPEYDTTPSPALIAIAAESLADLERVNYRPRLLRADRSLDRRGHGGAWDYRTGDER